MWKKVRKNEKNFRKNSEKIINCTDKMKKVEKNWECSEVHSKEGWKTFFFYFLKDWWCASREKKRIFWKKMHSYKKLGKLRFLKIAFQI